MYQSKADHYLANQVMSASPHRLIEIIVEAAIRNVRLSQREMEEKEYRVASDHLIKAQELINELRFSVDETVDPMFSNHLVALYDFMYQRLVLANLQKDVEMIQEVEQLLKEFLEAWHAIKEPQTRTH